VDSIPRDGQSISLLLSLVNRPNGKLGKPPNPQYTSLTQLEPNPENPCALNKNFR